MYASRPRVDQLPRAATACPRTPTSPSWTSDGSVDVERRHGGIARPRGAPLPLGCGLLSLVTPIRRGLEAAAHSRGAAHRVGCWSVSTGSVASPPRAREWRILPRRAASPDLRASSVRHRRKGASAVLYPPARRSRVCTRSLSAAYDVYRRREDAVRARSSLL